MNYVLELGKQIERSREGGGGGLGCPAPVGGSSRPLRSTGPGCRVTSHLVCYYPAEWQAMYLVSKVLRVQQLSNQS